jgi:D-inositol-3-phosphate glycosyltransferase
MSDPSAVRHIGFYCSSASWGGLEMNTVRYAGWMRDAGFKVTVYAVEESPLLTHSEAIELNTCLVERNSRYFDFRNVRTVARLFAAHQVDLIWFRDTRDMDLLAWVRRLSGNRLKLLYQQAMQFAIGKKDPIHTFRFGAIDAWIASLEFLAEQVRTYTRFPKERLHVVPLGVDHERLVPAQSSNLRTQLGIGPESFLAGIIGRVDPLKDQLCAVKALHLIRSEFPDTHLLIAGESTRGEGNAYELALKRQVNQLDLQKNVHFIPYTSEVGTIYSVLDAFLLTSKGETFGTVTIEAMSFGLPVIGTASSGTPELLDGGKAGLLYTPGNAEELSVQWMRLIREPALRDQLGEKALERFSTFYSKQSSVNGIIHIINQLIGVR